MVVKVWGRDSDRVRSSERTLAQAADALLSDQAVSLCHRVIGE
jgi:hypothetical protein